MLIPNITDLIIPTARMSMSDRRAVPEMRTAVLHIRHRVNKLENIFNCKILQKINNSWPTSHMKPNLNNILVLNYLYKAIHIQHWTFTVSKGFILSERVWRLIHTEMHDVVNDHWHGTPSSLRVIFYANCPQM